jgi:hypothetical protein
MSRRRKRPSISRSPAKAVKAAEVAHVLARGQTRIESVGVGKDTDSPLNLARRFEGVEAVDPRAPAVLLEDGI